MVLKIDPCAQRAAHIPSLPPSVASSAATLHVVCAVASCAEPRHTAGGPSRVRIVLDITRRSRCVLPSVIGYAFVGTLSAPPSSTEQPGLLACFAVPYGPI